MLKNFVEHGSSSFQIVDVLNRLNREMVANSFMLKCLLAKVDTIETYIKHQEINSTGTHTRTFLEPEFFSQFPIKNTEEFSSLENRIRNESGYILKLESYIKSIGGKDHKNNINRILAKLFSNQFAIQCSWTGRGKNINIKLGESATINAMKI
ncbi:uncharacterized protein LOC112683174 isoform X2 [Sipha flava]|uniref:Uncharacterized protein LOC112683174 isoform X2 n=1 Tax=Sipha flava TaxID=143950 RepID=A0A8B8FH46_9HEMI|nr:uncharacterized protein LOC112683174 isoform X2 [Sipha flava]